MIERCSRSNRCVFCGDFGFDIRVHYPEQEEVVHWCHKTSNTKGDLVQGSDGVTYRCINDHYYGGDTIGYFQLFTRYLTKEEWIEKQKRINPDWNDRSFRGGNSNVNTTKIAYKSIPKSEKGEVAGESKLLTLKQRDSINRYFASITVLEKEDREGLLSEWASGVEDVSHILDDWDIRTLPCPDKARFKKEKKYESLTRKGMIDKLYNKFNSLLGWPGVYLRSGDYYIDKTEKERCTFAPNSEYVMFPCYNKDGFLYGWRIKDKYPDRIVKEDVHKPFNGKFGYFHHSYDKEGIAHWMFHPENDIPYEVNESEVYGKVNGKYKTMASVTEKLVGKTTVNILEGGSRQGSPYSLYTKEGDNNLIVIATEGEKKAMVANAIKKCPVISIPGVNSFGVIFKKEEDGKSLIDTLKEKGTKYFVICYDSDKETNESVLGAEKKFIERLRDEGIQPMIGYWKNSFDKGLDDILLEGIEFKIKPC